MYFLFLICYSNKESVAVFQAIFVFPVKKVFSSYYNLFESKKQLPNLISHLPDTNKSLNHKAVYKGKKKRLIIIDMTKHHSLDCALVLQATSTSSIIWGIFSLLHHVYRFHLLYFTLPSQFNAL